MRKNAGFYGTQKKTYVYPKKYNSQKNARRKKVEFYLKSVTRGLFKQ